MTTLSPQPPVSEPRPGLSPEHEQWLLNTLEAQRTERERIEWDEQHDGERWDGLS